MKLIGTTPELALHTPPEPQNIPLSSLPRREKGERKAPKPRRCIHPDGLPCFSSHLADSTYQREYILTSPPQQREKEGEEEREGECRPAPPLHSGKSTERRKDKHPPPPTPSPSPLYWVPRRGTGRIRAASHFFSETDKGVLSPRGMSKHFALAAPAPHGSFFFETPGRYPRLQRRHATLLRKTSPSPSLIE